MYYYDTYISPLGKMIMISDGKYLRGLYFENQKYFIFDQNNYESKSLEIFNLTKKWLNLYFDHIIPDFTPPIKLNVTLFQEKVYNVLLSIPYGHTMTYGEVSQILCKQYDYKKMSAQAVGNAISHNPISLIIPCHRVIGKNHKLIGYAGGIDKKHQLLHIEGINLYS